MSETSSDDSVRIWDEETEQEIGYPYGSPPAPITGLGDKQTPGCHCPACATPGDESVCSYARDERSCYCRRCTDPDEDRDCYKGTYEACGRCGRRDWASLSVGYEPTVCYYCKWVIFQGHQQSDLERWA